MTSGGGSAKVWRCDAPTPSRHGRLFDGMRILGGVLHCESGAPFGVAHQSGTTLRVRRYTGRVGSAAQQTDETQPLFTVDRQTTMPGLHVFVAAVLSRVGVGAAHHLAPPVGHMCTMLLGDSPTEEGSQELIGLDQVVERVEPRPENTLTAHPLVDRRNHIVHCDRLRAHIDIHEAQHRCRRRNSRGDGATTSGRLARRPCACLMHVLVVDGANVVGSRPDGWWHDRAGAARRLQEKLSAAHLPYDEVVLVLEGKAKQGNPAGQKGRVRTVHAPGLGDDVIVEEVNRQVGAGDGRAVSVVTADRLLRERIEAAGATAKGPGWLLDQV